MYPKNNASPERIAVGQVVLISDGTVQSTGVAIVVRGQGGAEAAGGGTIAYGADNTVYYTPTQAETNFTSFVVIASKASCFSASQTIITTASSTSGQVDVKSIAGTAQTANDNGADINTLLTRIIGTLASGTHNPATAAQIAVLSDWINGGRLDLLLDAIKVVTDTQTAISPADFITLIFDRSLAAHQTALTAGRAITLGGVPIAETTATGTPTTTEIILAAGSAIDNAYQDHTVKILSGAATGQARVCSGYTGATKTCSFDEAFETAASASDVVAVSLDHVHPVTEIQAGLATEAKQDIIDTNVDTLNTNVPDVISLAAINAEADTALTDYDGPTNAEMEVRTPTAAQLAYIVSNSADGKPVTFTGGTTTTAILGNVDGVAASSTDDVYNGRILIFNAGTLDEQATDITDYVGSTKTATITAVTTAVTSGHTANLK